MLHKSIFNWSGGKDSALALYKILKDDQYKISGLLTSVNSAFKRVSMHGVREELLDEQALQLKLPLYKLQLPEQPSMDEYNDKMSDMMQHLRDDGFTHSVFGDIFLEDLKKYREEKLETAGFKAVFPIWKRNTTELIREFIELGFKTVVVCVKAELLDKCFAGRIIDDQFIKDLPPGVDPCGENGEFHTFVFDGPIFSQPIGIEIGEKVFKEYKSPASSGNMGFWFCDIKMK